MEKIEEAAAAEAAMGEHCKTVCGEGGTVPVSAAEYQQLIACRVMLDMILCSKSEHGYYDSAVLDAAGTIRGQCLRGGRHGT